MNCKQIQFSFFDYADDMLDKNMHSAIELHLSGCPACRLHYETQRRLHQDITNAVASELADLHFQQKSINAKPSGIDPRPSLGMWVRSMAFAVPPLLLLCIILWPLLKPAPKVIDDQVQSAYAEAFHYLKMYNTDRPGASSLTTPLAVIMQPGSPARVIELDGTTDLSAELK
jgi:hypothetical protein